MNLDDLTRRGLYLSDIPLHDATRDLVLLGEQFREEYKLTQELEILTDRLQHTLRALEDEKKKTDRLDAPPNSRRRTNAFHAGSSARFLLLTGGGTERSFLTVTILWSRGASSSKP